MTSSITPLRVHSDAKLTLALEQSHDHSVSPDVRLSLDLRIPFGELLEQMQQFLKLHGAKADLGHDLRQWLPNGDDEEEDDEDDEDEEEEEDDEDEEDEEEDGPSDEEVDGDENELEADGSTPHRRCALDEAVQRVASSDKIVGSDVDDGGAGLRAGLDYANKSRTSAERTPERSFFGTGVRSRRRQGSAESRRNARAQKDLLLFPERAEDPLGLASVIGRKDVIDASQANDALDRRDRSSPSDESGQVSFPNLPGRGPWDGISTRVNPSTLSAKVDNAGRVDDMPDPTRAGRPSQQWPALDLLSGSPRQSIDVGANNDEPSAQLCDAFGRPVGQNQSDFPTAPWHSNKSSDMEPKGIGKASDAGEPRGIGRPAAVTPSLEPEARGIGRSA